MGVVYGMTSDCSKSRRRREPIGPSTEPENQFLLRNSKSRVVTTL